MFGQLCNVELGGRTLGFFYVESLYEFLLGHLFAVISRRPAEKRKVVEKRFGKETFFLEVAYESIAVALAVRLARRVDYHRKMSVNRRRITERFEKEEMAVCVLNMVVAADDVRDLLRDVVAYVCEVEDRAGIASDYDEILYAVKRFRKLALDHVAEKHFPADKAEFRGSGEFQRFNRVHALRQTFRIQLEHYFARLIDDLKVFEPGKARRVFNGFALCVYREIDKPGARYRKFRGLVEFNLNCSALSHERV
jgi:hypothetical protein